MLLGSANHQLLRFICYAHRRRKALGAARHHARKQFVWGAGHPAVSSFGAPPRDEQSKRGGQVIMFRAAISLFVIACVLAIISAILGFSGIAAGAAGAAKILFYVSIVIAVMAMVGALLFGRTSEA